MRQKIRRQVSINSIPSWINCGLHSTAYQNCNFYGHVLMAMFQRD